MSKKVDVKYNDEYLKLLRLLSNINEKFLIKKTKDKKHIEIESKNAATTVAYILKTKVKNFDFNGDEVGFYKFSEFNELFNAFESPKLKQDDEKFEISKDKSKITYFVADPESIPTVFRKIDFKDPDLVVTLPEEEFSNIKKMIGLLDAETVEFSVKNAKLTIKLAGDDKDSSYEKQYEVDDLNITADDFSVKIPQDIFLLDPKSEYEIQIKEEGIVKFEYKNNPEFELDLYTAENEDE